ncbi:Peptidoglycan/LPS O-acetylase OafA/YrhL, contains acyltransferase and SGNH-hydrolase domains [Micromonospora rhizosphaerae]|uniref:Peptidoglycan/LPS O-acetylase OafA/YrhL, contains acyltransferase and SGNH-hydrolase domains n=1 Tax=Micromonospora rhizosphaerae TaxID=568872 RepID=A0A1C6SDP8_9ACTN|nr:Peptidoglycan/LPS O-acetylase OafA/YrhL, contains acyltransferase and SGNH-hydrolase domains [Micromonospora rhizosphaerae]
MSLTAYPTHVSGQDSLRDDAVARTAPTADVAPGPGREHKPGRPRIRVLDGLRLIAALMVVMYHYFGFASMPSAYGWLGVQLFFLISGFVICMSGMGHTVGQFATSRIVRLFPAYWFGVLLTSAFLLIWHVRRAPTIGEIAVNVTMLQGGLGVRSVDGVYWTLWAELRFYLLFSLVVWFGVTYRRAVAFCVVWLLGAVLTMKTPGIANTVFVSEWAPYFVAGIAFFLIHRYGQNVLLWGIVAVCFLISENHILALTAHTNKIAGRSDLPAWPAGLLLALFFALMAAVALGWLRVDWKWLSVAGALTYPLYLIHQYVGWTILAKLADLPYLPLRLGLVAFMLAAAWCIHRFVERPMARRMRPALARAFSSLDAPVLARSRRLLQPGRGTAPR